MNAATETALQNVFNKIKNTPTFHPANVNLFARHDGWTRQAGDIIRVQSDEENYDLPITNLSLHWTGSSKTGGGETTTIAIEAAGNPEREPLPELRRKNYNTDAQIAKVRRYANATQQQLVEDEQHYSTEFTKTNKEIGMTARISGVKLDNNGNVVWQQKKDAQGNPLYYDENGNETTINTGNPVYTNTPEWDDANGAELWGRLNITGVMSQMMNAIKNSAGVQMAIGSVSTTPGAVLIEALNTNNTGTAKINANIVKIQSTTGSGINIDANGNVSVVAKGVVDKINDTQGDAKVIVDADHVDISGVVSAAGFVTSGDIFTYKAGGTWLTFGNIEGTNVYQTNAYITNLNVATRDDNYESFNSHSISMGTIGTGMFLGTKDLNLTHAHQVTMNDNGTLTLGSAVAVGDNSANFNIANTTWFKNQMALAREQGAAQAGGTSVDDIMFGSLTVGTYNVNTGTIPITFVATAYHETGDEDDPYESLYSESETIYPVVSSVYQAGANSVTLRGGWNDGTYKVTTSGKTTESEMSTELSEITTNGNSSMSGSTITTPCKVTDTNNATVFTDNISLGISNSFKPETNSANHILVGSATSVVNGATYNSASQVIGYLRNTAHGGNVYGTLIVSSALRQLNSDAAENNLTYAKTETSVMLSNENTYAASLTGTETTSIGASRVNAKVGGTTYAYSTHSITVGGGADIIDEQGTSEVTFALDGVTVARRKVRATYPGQSQGTQPSGDIAGEWKSGTYTVTTPSDGTISTTLFDLGLGTWTVSGSNLTNTYDIGYRAIVSGQAVRGGSTGKTGTISLPIVTNVTPSTKTITTNNGTAVITVNVGGKQVASETITATIPTQSGDVDSIVANGKPYVTNGSMVISAKALDESKNVLGTDNIQIGAVSVSGDGVITEQGESKTVIVSVNNIEIGRGTVIANVSDTGSTYIPMTIKSTPTWNGTSNNVSLRQVTFTTTDNNDSKSVTLYLTQDASWTNHKKYVYMRPNSQSNDYVARLEVDASSEASSGSGGTLGNWVWSTTNNPSAYDNNTVSISITGTNTSKSLPLYLTQNAKWDTSHQKRVYLRDTSTQGNLHASILVDASSEYNQGKTDQGTINQTALNTAYANGVDAGYAAGLAAAGNNNNNSGTTPPIAVETNQVFLIGTTVRVYYSTTYKDIVVTGNAQLPF